MTVGVSQILTALSLLKPDERQALRELTEPVRASPPQLEKPVASPIELTREEIKNGWTVESLRLTALNANEPLAVGMVGLRAM